MEVTKKTIETIRNDIKKNHNKDESFDKIFHKIKMTSFNRKISDLSLKIRTIDTCLHAIENIRQGKSVCYDNSVMSLMHLDTYKEFIGLMFKMLSDISEGMYYDNEQEERKINKHYQMNFKPSNKAGRRMMNEMDDYGIYDDYPECDDYDYDDYYYRNPKKNKKKNVNKSLEDDAQRNLNSIKKTIFQLESERTKYFMTAFYAFLNCNLTGDWGIFTIIMSYL